jgi:hypothetical protein
MALGDSIKVFVDEGGRSPEEVLVRAGGAGGSVKWSIDGPFVRVDELTASKKIRRSILVRQDKLVRLTVEPRG